MKLLIVEASYPEDFYSERLDGQMMERLTKLLHIESRLVYAMDRKHLAKAIALAKQDDYDVVHLSCHGADAGIAVTDRTNIDWPEFVQLFKARRYSPRALVMSTCCGATSGLAQEFEKKGARPEIIFGSTDERDFNEYAVAWTILYDRFRRDGVERNVAQDALRDISAVVHSPPSSTMRCDKAMTSEPIKEEPASWHLIHAYNNTDIGNPEQAFNLHGIAELSEDQVAALRKDRKAILDYGACLHLVEAVEANIDDFHQAVNDCAEYITHDFKNLTEEVADEMELNLSRLMVNISAMFRAFLDHSETYLKRSFGEQSAEFETWKKSKSDQFDNFFAYRFFYGLRNYIQHVDMPPFSLSFSAAAETNAIAMRVDLIRDQLLIEKDKWRGSVVAEIQAQPEKFSALAIIDDWQQCFTTISKTRLRISADKALAAARRLLDTREHLGKPYGRLCIGFMPAGPIPRGQINFNLEWLPEPMAKLVVERASRSTVT